MKVLPHALAANRPPAPHNYRESWSHRAVQLPFAIDESHGSPVRWLYLWLSSFPEEVESRAHQTLDESRLKTDRDFFTTSVERAVEAVQLAAIEVAGLEAWLQEPRTIIRAGIDWP